MGHYFGWSCCLCARTDARWKPISRTLELPSQATFSSLGPRPTNTRWVYVMQSSDLAGQATATTTKSPQYNHNALGVIERPPIPVSDGEHDCLNKNTSKQSVSSQPDYTTPYRPCTAHPHSRDLDLSSNDEVERPCREGSKHTIGPEASYSEAWTVPDDICTTDDVKRHVLLIHKDPTISQHEKSRRCQLVLMAPYKQRQQQDNAEFRDRTKNSSTAKSYSNVRNPDTGEFMLGCEHYPRKCKLLADCCDAWVVCRHCHDQHNPGHVMTRFNTKRVLCMECNLEQPVSKTCINSKCAIEFAHYFCPKCKFFDDTPDKSIYHCDHCRICRVGKGLGHDNFHCSICDACVSLKYREDHRCLKRSLDAHCPVCKQYLYTSTRPVVFMKCGHTMHAHCFDDYIKTYYTCPLCQKALTNMATYYNQIDQAVSSEVLPEEIRNKRAEILCHDCGRRCETQYHYSHLKCTHCNSYNTRLIRTIDASSLRSEEESSTSRPAPSDANTHPLDEGENAHIDNECESTDGSVGAVGINDGATGTAAPQRGVITEEGMDEIDMSCYQQRDLWVSEGTLCETEREGICVSDEGQCSTNYMHTAEASPQGGPLPSKRHADHYSGARSLKKSREVPSYEVHETLDGDAICVPGQASLGEPSDASPNQETQTALTCSHDDFTSRGDCVGTKNGVSENIERIQESGTGCGDQEESDLGSFVMQNGVAALGLQSTTGQGVPKVRDAGPGSARSLYNAAEWAARTTARCIMYSSCDGDSICGGANYCLAENVNTVEERCLILDVF